MKTIKILSIIGLVIAVLTFICVVSFDNATNYEAGLGWGMILACWTIAQSIVGIVKASKPEVK